MLAEQFSSLFVMIVQVESNKAVEHITDWIFLKNLDVCTLRQVPQVKSRS
jgi:hypothetical protein